MAPCLIIALLLVRGDRVVNERLHTLLCKKRLQLVALLAEDGKLVVHIVGIGQTLGQRDERIADVAVVKVAASSALSVVTAPASPMAPMFLPG